MIPGGEATLVRVKDIEGMLYAAVVALFNEARATIIKKGNFSAIARFAGRLIPDIAGRNFLQPLRI